MQDEENQVEIGPGGWVLVALAAAITFVVLRLMLGYDLFPTAVFALAMALVVLLILYRLAAAISRYDDEEDAARRVRKIVPSAVAGSEGASPRLAVQPAQVQPVRPQVSAVVRPLSEVEPAPLIPPPPVAADPAPVAPGPVAAVMPLAPVDPAPAAMPAAAKAKVATAGKPAAKMKAGGAAKATWQTKPGAAPVATSGSAAEAGKAAPEAKAKAKAKSKAAAKVDGPARLAAPRKGRADDLKLILGVGPKLEQVCNRLGFYHFDQIAGWSAADVDWVDRNLEGFKGRVSRDRWVIQARILAAGGSAEEAERAARI